jgi:hypothetical protein
VAVRSSSIVVGTAATLVVRGIAAHGQAFAVKNNGAQTVFLGGQGVTSANGYPLAAGEAMSLDLSSSGSEDVYGVVVSGTCELRTLGLGR